MSQSKLNTSRVVRLLLKDALPTLGERGRAEVLRLAAHYEPLAGQWLEGGRSLRDAQRAFDQAVVDGLQQAAHDLFWDTTWPVCPLHGRHPLWYDETREAWRCEQNPAVVAALGSLADFQAPAT